jgi:hypothetical protein
MLRSLNKFTSFRCNPIFLSVVVPIIYKSLQLLSSTSFARNCENGFVFHGIYLRENPGERLGVLWRRPFRERSVCYSRVHVRPIRIEARENPIAYSITAGKRLAR